MRRPYEIYCYCCSSLYGIYVIPAMYLYYNNIVVVVVVVVNTRLVPIYYKHPYNNAVVYAYHNACTYYYYYDIPYIPSVIGTYAYAAAVMASYILLLLLLGVRVFVRIILYNAQNMMYNIFITRCAWRPRDHDYYKYFKRVDINIIIRAYRVGEMNLLRDSFFLISTQLQVDNCAAEFKTAVYKS